MTTVRKRITNAKIVLPDRVVFGDMLIERNRIAEILPNAGRRLHYLDDSNVIDAAGAYVLPGIIDIHSDAIEKEIQPRPKTMFPLKMSFYELEKKLVTAGITTMYHSLSLCDTNESEVRDSAVTVEIIERIQLYCQQRSMINHKVHLRYEITFLKGVVILEELIRKGLIDFLSYMDHTPGQGQFSAAGTYQNYTMKQFGLSTDEVNALVEKITDQQRNINWEKLQQIAETARCSGIRLASHDDDTREKIDSLVAFNGVVSEFPINLETAVYAKSHNIYTCVGAPNIIRGGSHSDNLKAMDAIKAGAADIICSDYLPSTLLPAVFKLHEEGIALSKAVSMVSVNPARALGIDGQLGSIEAGKIADLVIVELEDGYPVVRKLMAKGNVVYQTDSYNNELEDIECMG